MMQGLIQIYCGEGKGKTTAAVGQAVRSAGCGLSVIFARLMKTDRSGELAVLSGVPGVTLLPCEKCFGFSWTMNEEQRAEARCVYQGIFDRASSEAKMAAEKSDALLVVDEFMSAYELGFLDREKVLEFLRTKPENLEVILTGRNPAPELLELADYVSEVKKIKHPFDQGIRARRGIEY